MIRTHGLSHVALSVVEPERSLAFYRAVLGVREYFRSDTTIQVLGPGQYDVIAFERRPADAGTAGGIIDFGFRLPGPRTLTRRLAQFPQRVAISCLAGSSHPDCRMPSSRILMATRSRSGNELGFDP